MQHPICNIGFQCMDNPTTPHHHPIMPAQLEGVLAATNSSKPYTQNEKKVKPQQEQAPPSLKCPRCDSINTKFCYYNNYSLTQPRYFCKACKRYWTQGGSIRKIPVGGSCNKKKSSKKSSSTKKSQDQSVSTTNYNAFPSITSVSNDVTLTFSSHQNHQQLTSTTSEYMFGLGPDTEPMSTVFGRHGNIQFDTLRSSTSTSTSTSTTNNSNSSPNTLLFEALKSGFLETQSGSHDLYGNGSMGEVENGIFPNIQMNGTKEIAAATTTTTATVTTITRKQEFCKDTDGENNTLLGNFPWQVNEESNIGGSAVGSGKELYANGGLGASWYALINSL